MVSGSIRCPAEAAQRGDDEERPRRERQSVDGGDKDKDEDKDKEEDRQSHAEHLANGTLRGLMATTRLLVRVAHLLVQRRERQRRRKGKVKKKKSGPSWRKTQQEAASPP